MRITTVLWVLCSIGAVALGAGTGTLLVNSTKGKTNSIFASQSGEKATTASFVSAAAKPETPMCPASATRASDPDSSPPAASAIIKPPVSRAAQPTLLSF